MRLPPTLLALPWYSGYYSSLWHWQPGLESRWRHLLLPTRGWMAEWSKALVLGTSNFGCAGSNPAPVIRFLPAGAPKREGTTRFELVTCGSAIRCSTTELCTHRLETCRRGSQCIPPANEVFLVGVVGNISACHADARGSIPRRGAFLVSAGLVELRSRAGLRYRQPVIPW